MARILIIEDEESYRDATSFMLRKEGFEVFEAADGAAGLALYDTHGADLVLLDVMMPGMPGTEVCRQLRARGPVGIVMVTARDSEIDKVVGLELGADDYVTKPFSHRELVARIRAVLRRIRPGLAEDRVHIGDLTIDRVAHRVKRAGKEIHLGPTEFRLLEFLMQSPGRVFSREQLLDGVWGQDVYIDERTVDVHVGRLRKAINRGRQSDPIRTVRGAGYSFNEMFARAH